MKKQKSRKKKCFKNKLREKKISNGIRKNIHLTGIHLLSSKAEVPLRREYGTSKAQFSLKQILGRV